MITPIIIVVIPTYNEVETIGIIINELKKRRILEIEHKFGKHKYKNLNRKTVEYLALVEI